MQKFIKYLESIGFKPEGEFAKIGPHSIWLYRGDDWVSVYKSLNSKYKGHYCKVYTKNSIRTSDYESSRVKDVLQWLKVAIDY